MLFSIPEDVLHAILKELAKRDLVNLLLCGREAFEKTAPTFYRTVFLTSIHQAKIFEATLTGKRGAFLRPFVQEIHIDIQPYSQGLSIRIRERLSSDPSELNVLATVIPRCRHLNLFRFSGMHCILGQRVLDSLRFCTELAVLIVYVGPLKQMAGGPIRDYQLPKTLRRIYLYDLAVPNALITGLLSASAGTLAHVFLETLRTPYEGKASVETCYLKGLAESKWPALREVRISNVEEPGLVVSSVGLATLLRGSSLHSFYIESSTMKHDSGGAFDELAKHSQLKDLMLHVNFAAAPNGCVAAFLRMLKSLPKTLGRLELCDLDLDTAQQPAVDLEQLIGALVGNASLASSLKDLLLGIYGLKADHYRLLLRRFTMLESFTRLVSPDNESRLVIVRGLADGLVDAHSLRSITVNLLVGNFQGRAAEQWATFPQRVRSLQPNKLRADVARIMPGMPLLESFVVNGNMYEIDIDVRLGQTVFTRDPAKPGLPYNGEDLIGRAFAHRMSPCDRRRELRPEDSCSIQ